MENFNLSEALRESGYGEGQKFASPAEVREYFTRKNMRDMFNECDWTDEQLTKMANWIIQHREHCSFV